MKHQLEMVRSFMRAFGQPTSDQLAMPDAKQIKLRCDLITEENLELGFCNDPVQYADAVCDLLYVVLGAAIDAGINPSQLEAMFDEVHRSNMTKFWSSDDKEEALNRSDLTFHYARVGLFIARNAAGKIIKPKSYSPPNLRQFIDP